MKLLADNDVYKITVDFLRQHGHDVVTAKELGLNKASDKELLKRLKLWTDYLSHVIRTLECWSSLRKSCVQVLFT